MKKFSAILLFIFAALSLQAQPFLRLPRLISDNMVVQAESTVKLWGWIEPGTTVDISTSWGESVQAKADYSSMFLASVKTPAGSFDPQTITFSTNRKGVVIKREVKNVLVGQVWLCAGQSNMNYSASTGVVDMNEIIENRQLNGRLVLFTAPKHCSASPQEDVQGEWSVCDENSAYWFSSVGYFFGDKLQKSINQPIGLVNVSWGGTPVELWTRPEALDRDARESWKTLTYSKRKGWGIGYGYNGMIAPMVNMTVAGVIWYQGEANRNNSSMYAKDFSAMIEDWRARFGQDLPFYFVQIAPKEYDDKDLKGALVREQQEIVAKNVNNTGIVAIPDCVDDITDIHPKYKKTVGERLANQALTDVYHKDMGKVKHAAYQSMQVKGDKVIVSFANAQGGLQCTGDSVIGLEISDGASLYPAQGMINGETLVVWAKGVRKPVAVRYCFNQTIGNLVDVAGLPVLPFRSDQDAATVVSPAKVKKIPAGKSSAIALKAAPVRISAGSPEIRTISVGAQCLVNRKYKFSDVDPSIDGWQMLCMTGGSNESHAVKITALEDGPVYVLARKNKITAPLLSDWKRYDGIQAIYQTNDPEKPGILYLYGINMKKGQSLELDIPDFPGNIITAPSISK